MIVFSPVIRPTQLLLAYSSFVSFILLIYCALLIDIVVCRLYCKQ